MSERTILHCDLNNFYASVECFHNPELRDKPVAVCGDPDARHGIVLAKNYIAKTFGIKTGDVIWEARLKCPSLVTVKADFKKYLRYSAMAKKIYLDFAYRIEPFGIDECWLDVSGGDGKKIADEIRERIKFEMGVTASVGVSWNKIFAKLGSDLKKPDATTVIDRGNYERKIFPLPVEELLYVGRATKVKLNKYGIKTIGGLAGAPRDFLRARLGKWGDYLWSYANGFDCSPVRESCESDEIKSVGNSITAPRDLLNELDVRMLVTVLSESVAERLREQNLCGGVVSLSLRDCNLFRWSRQRRLSSRSDVSRDFIDCAMEIFEDYGFVQPIRSVGLSVSSLESRDLPIQLDFAVSEQTREKNEGLERAVGEIRSRFGHFAISRAVEYVDKELTGINLQSDHAVHPRAFALTERSAD